MKRINFLIRARRGKSVLQIKSIEDCKKLKGLKFDYIVVEETVALRTDAAKI